MKIGLFGGNKITVISMGNRMGRVKLRINITRVFTAISENTRAHFFSKLGILKSTESASREKILARRKLQNFQLLLNVQNIKGL